MHPLADKRRRDGKLRHLHLDDRVWRFHGITGALHPDKRHKLNQLVNAVPVRQIFDHIRPDNEIKLIIRMHGDELLDRIVRIGRPLPFKLDRLNTKVWMTGHRQLEHAEPILAFRHLFVLLMGRKAVGQKPNL